MNVRRTDVLAGVAGAAIGAASAAVEQHDAAAYAAGLLVGGAFALSRSRPRLAWIVTAGALLATSPLVATPTGIALLAVVQAFFAGRGDTSWWGVAGFAAIVAGLELNQLLTHDSGVPALLLPAATWGAGRALREREVVAQQLAERVSELEDEREAHAALSVRYERARIASELHDIVAHAISVMVIQASAGQRLAARDPEATAEAFEAIAGAARQAERDMGRLVALLGDEEAIGPAPDLSLVEELVARASGSGLDVTLRLGGEREGLPAPVVETAFRVVQEGLTNALRYAAGAPVLVEVAGDRDGLVVSVSNGPAPPEATLAGFGTGSGIDGLRQRIDACGGALEAGPAPGRGWRLQAWLPRRSVAHHPRG